LHFALAPRAESKSNDAHLPEMASTGDVSAPESAANDEDLKLSCSEKVLLITMFSFEMVYGMCLFPWWLMQGCPD
jgi:hypothetical protein